MPIVSDKTLALFQALCREYNLTSDPKQEGFSWSLLNIMSERLDGDGYRTELEHLEDTFPLGDLAKLLELLMRDNGLSVKNGSKDLVFDNPATVVILEKMLTDKLKEKVFRYGKALVIHKGDGRDGSHIITSNVPGRGDKFSLDELSEIINMETDFAKRTKDLRGKKAKKSDSYTHTPDLREIIGHPDKGTGLFYHVNKLPFSGTVERYSFLYDFMSICGFLDFMDEQRKDNIETENKGKYNYIASLLI